MCPPSVPVLDALELVAPVSFMVVPWDPGGCIRSVPVRASHISGYCGFAFDQCLSGRSHISACSIIN